MNNKKRLETIIRSLKSGKLPDRSIVDFDNETFSYDYRIASEMVKITSLTKPIDIDAYFQFGGGASIATGLMSIRAFERKLEEENTTS